MSGIKHAQEESQGFHVDVGNKTHRQEESEGFHVDDGIKHADRKRVKEFT